MASGSKTFLRPELRALVERSIDWPRWDRVIAENGITIDRPRGSHHPDHPAIIYPIDYGYVNGTLGTDGNELDVFIGSASTRLVGTMITIDYRKGDTEFKLIYDCSPAEIYLVNGFINFDRRLMEGELALRWEMQDIWKMASPDASR
jgi:inorganic pyrophosphatase